MDGGSFFVLFRGSWEASGGRGGGGGGKEGAANNRQGKGESTKCALPNRNTSAETRSRRRSSAALRDRDGWGGGESFRTRLLEFSEGDEGILEKLHLASELCGPQNQSPVPTLSQVSGTEPEGKTGPDRARARRNPKTFGDSFPKLFHRPFGAAPSLPSSSSRNPTHSACI